MAHGHDKHIHDFQRKGEIFGPSQFYGSIHFYVKLMKANLFRHVVIRIRYQLAVVIKVNKRMNVVIRVKNNMGTTLPVETAFCRY